MAETLAFLLSDHAVTARNLRVVLGGQAYDNQGRTYTGSDDDAALNAGVPRFTAMPEAVLEILTRYTTTGRLEAPLVSIHTTGDPVIPLLAGAPLSFQGCRHRLPAVSSQPAGTPPRALQLHRPGHPDSVHRPGRDGDEPAGDRVRSRAALNCHVRHRGLPVVVGPGAAAGRRHRPGDERGARASRSRFEGYHCEPTLRLGVRRLSIQDLPGGTQPVYNEDRSIALVFNGEIYNFHDLRRRLVDAGHRFQSRCDTEVLVHLYEERGVEAVEDLEGQFAFALWDARAKRLFVGRDRVGKRPFFYTTAGDTFVFASEIKSLLLHPETPRRIDRRCLDQVFTFFMPVNPRTMFEGVSSLPPGRCLEVVDGRVRVWQYWHPPVPDLGDEDGRSDEEWIDGLRRELQRAVETRMVADVNVGASLSGGLDSSVVACLMKEASAEPVRTYSICHEDPYHDEGRYSRQVATALGTEHREVVISPADIAALLPELVWRVEAPSCKTSCAAYIRLYQMLRETSTVVLTGEGADEALGGYPNVRMLKVLDFCRRHPSLSGASRLMERVLPRGSVLRVMYHEPVPLAAADASWVMERFGCIPADLQRFRSQSAIKAELFSGDTLAALGDYSAEQELADTLVDPELLRGRHFMQQAQYFEYLLKLPNYLLINPGDRAAMTHSVETRCPFLDHRLIEFCMAMPLRLRVRGLTEKYALRRAFAAALPPEIIRRTKRPFTTFYVSSLFRHSTDERLEDAVSEASVTRAGLFHWPAVRALRDAVAAPDLSREEQVRLETPFSLVVTAQLWHQMFIEQFRPQPV